MTVNKTNAIFLPCSLNSLMMLNAWCLAVCRFKANFFFGSTPLPSFSVACISVVALSWFYYSCNFSVAFQFVVMFIWTRDIKIHVLKPWAWIFCWWRWGNAENRGFWGEPNWCTHSYPNSSPAASSGDSSPAGLCLFSKTSISWSRTWGKSQLLHASPCPLGKEPKRPPKT